ncbi:hypothetical protein SKAU_G00292700 [Synaphobranchus kaupii]|uniref:Endonuclease/exonuclease/phosphatase domain-containing protein n=1 Tax=Synaphobranchus kaupii TaxID=118154 RepID=A0A9Q1EU34_SYNKA|nr:hypothetical protein SKAU_G00292700 [Synaphobranchus kaupii]
MVSVAKTFQYPAIEPFSRPPFVVMFSYRKTEIFALIPQHTSPPDAFKQIDALYDVVEATRNELKTDNIILLGDFNAGCTYVTTSDWQYIRLRTDKSFHWLIPDSADTTVSVSKPCPYDRIVATEAMIKAVVPDSAMVYDYRKGLGLDQKTALAVSDHFPVEVKLFRDKESA